MAIRRLRSPRRGALGAAACGLLQAAAWAQGTSTVTVTGRSEAPISIGGFGAPLSVSPMQGAVFSAAQLRELGIASMSGLTRLEPGLSDGYNSPGYWSQLTVRGFVLDNRGNYRRDGLPINAETAIALANKERVEVLFGTSGLQAGTGSPGGLVNLVVKRPTETARELTVEAAERGSAGVAVDVSQRFGVDRQFGARLNAAAAELRPQLRNSRGERQLWALALDWQLSADTLLEAELESSHQSQPSMPGFSLLGNRLPSAKAVDPRLNLNNQPWSLPVVLDGDTASLRWKQRLGSDWSATVQAGSQRLRSDDRVAFPFGCYDAGGDTYFADRYCPDGSYDLYDFRSENERRRVDAIDVHADGRVRLSDIEHRLSLGVLGSRTKDRFQRQAYNYSGTGNVEGTLFTPAAPELTDENTNRDERSREIYLRDAITLSSRWQLWAGARHTRIERRSARTDGSRATDYAQSFTTPWLALSFRPAPDVTAYLSWGQGIESEVVPNRSRYDNRGVVLPSLKSRQWEAGVKGGGPDRAWSLAWFDIRRPMAQDFCDANGEHCRREIDGVARHRGIDASVQLRAGAWSARAGAEWLDAQRQGSRTAGANGLWPTNVPKRTARLQGGYDLSPAITLHAYASHEGRRAVLPDNTIWIPSWTRLDLAATWRTRLGSADLLLRAGVENVGDERAWRESPYQFSHAYLYPLTPRTWRVTMSTRF